MFEEKEQSLAKRAEYSLRAPKVPRQSVDVFARDVQNGNYGLSSQKVDTLLSYVTLQHTLSSFDDLTFSPDFIGKLPSKLQEKLGDNLYPGIALSYLEIPTTDKVLTARMLAADRLTEALSKEPVEVWVTPQIKKELEGLNCAIDTGLQLIDYSKLALEAKFYLVEVMAGQESQTHTILAARHRFPDGVPPLGFTEMFSGKGERTKFDTLRDLEGQYKVAQQALNNPLLLLYADFFEKIHQQTQDIEGEKIINTKNNNSDELPIDVSEEAKESWWAPGMTGMAVSYEDQAKIADYLRPRYLNKTIYGILNANTSELQEEALAAFWRMDSPRQIDFGEEPWIKNELYLKTDGTLEHHFRDDLYGEREICPIAGLIESIGEVAMVDQTIKWIQEETTKMQKVKETWEKKHFAKNVPVESTLVATFGINHSSELQEEINGLPKWFFDALNQEVGYYSRLISYSPRFDLNDLTALLTNRNNQDQNPLKSYFDLAHAKLEKDKRLIVNPIDLYQDLDLDSSASQDEAKRAYRKIAKETMAIQISSPEEFDSEVWAAMNERYVKATRAYTAISKHRLGDDRVTTLGKLSSYFKIED